MKITKSKLKQIIKEETRAVLSERSNRRSTPGIPQPGEVERMGAHNVDINKRKLQDWFERVKVAHTELYKDGHRAKMLRKYFKDFFGPTEALQIAGSLDKLDQGLLNDLRSGKAYHTLGFADTIVARLNNIGPLIFSAASEEAAAWTRGGKVYFPLKNVTDIPGVHGSRQTLLRHKTIFEHELDHIASLAFLQHLITPAIKEYQRSHPEFYAALKVLVNGLGRKILGLANWASGPNRKRLQKIFGSAETGERWMADHPWEEKRSYGLSWQNLFIANITPEVVETLCQFRDKVRSEAQRLDQIAGGEGPRAYEKALGAPNVQRALSRSIELVRTLDPYYAEMSKNDIKEMIFVIYGEIWNKMSAGNNEGCNDPAGTAEALNNLAKANTRKATRTAE